MPQKQEAKNLDAKALPTNESDLAKGGVAAPPKAKRKLTNRKLKKLATKHKPPQTWFDNDADESW